MSLFLRPRGDEFRSPRLAQHLSLLSLSLSLRLYLLILLLFKEARSRLCLSLSAFLEFLALRFVAFCAQAVLRLSELPLRPENSAASVVVRLVKVKSVALLCVLLFNCKRLAEAVVLVVK